MVQLGVPFLPHEFSKWSRFTISLAAMWMNPGRLGLPTTCRVAAGTTVRSTQWRGRYGGVSIPNRLVTTQMGMRDGFLWHFFFWLFFSVYIYIAVFLKICFIFDVSILLFVQVMIYVFSAVRHRVCRLWLVGGRQQQDSIAAFLAAGTTEVSFYVSHWGNLCYHSSFAYMLMDVMLPTGGWSCHFFGFNLGPGTEPKESKAGKKGTFSGLVNDFQIT